MTLTLEAALALPAGPELDALVAERVMGWAQPSRTYDGLAFYRNRDGAIRPWSPSTDIAAAWEVVEKMPMWFCVTRENDGMWCAYPRGLRWVYGKTAPLAICYAALQVCWKD